VVNGLDPEQPVQNIRTMDELRDELLTSQRFSALLLASFAVTALGLASVGIYSVLSYIVRGRSREIGIRAALGAQAGDVLRLVVLEGMTPALIGIAVGAAGAGGAARQHRPSLAGQPPESADDAARLRRHGLSRRPGPWRACGSSPPCRR
jgi:predicted lysophospholipase L1 biosynthesis ABC-type transport system permease subunit